MGGANVGYDGRGAANTNAGQQQGAGFRDGVSGGVSGRPMDTNEVVPGNGESPLREDGGGAARLVAGGAHRSSAAQKARPGSRLLKAGNVSAAFGVVNAMYKPGKSNIRFRLTKTTMGSSSGLRQNIVVYPIGLATRKTTRAQGK